MSTPVTNQIPGSSERAVGDVPGVEAARVPRHSVLDGGNASLAAQPAQQNSQARERIVMVMMALVAVAVGAVSHVHFGYAIAGATMTGLFAFAVFMALNGLLVRSAEIDRLRGEVARLEAANARGGSQGQSAGESIDAATQQGPSTAVPANRTRMGKGASPYAVTGATEQSPQRFEDKSDGDVLPHAAPMPDARWESTQAPRNARLMPAGQRPGQSSAQNPAQSSPQMPLDTSNAAEGEPPTRGAMQAPHGRARSAPMPGGAEDPRAATHQGAHAPEFVDVPGWSGTSEMHADALRDAWSSDDTEPDEYDAARSQKTTAQPYPGNPSMQDRRQSSEPVRSVEADLELVQRKIKALADEVNATEISRQQSHAGEAGAGGPQAKSAPPYTGDLDQSVAALRTSAHRMKQSSPGGTNAPAKGATSYAPRSMADQGTAPGGYSPGMLPSLDSLIPASAQPIAVSRDDADDASLTENDYDVSTQARPNPSRAAPENLVANKQAPDKQALDKPGQQAPMATQINAAAQASARSESQYKRAPQGHEAPRNTAPAPAPAPGPTQAPAPTSALGSAPVRGPGNSSVASDGRPAAPSADNGGKALIRKMADIAAAIDASRMDVYLKPIVGLGDYGVAHFEVDVRLKTASGGYIDGAQDMLSLESRDLLALFDIERLNRAVRVAEQLHSRGKEGSLLSPTAGQSMTDGKFLDAFARTHEERSAISGQLVLTFTQDDIAAFGPGTMQALADMNSFGFRFALSEVTHLAMDFDALAECGFAFVKLPTEAFLEGMSTGHGMVPPADICRHMAGAGLTLVVDGIDDQAQLAKVFGFGALFGQGQLFGGARQITLQSLAEKRTAAA